jgi:hypothetical protein
LDAREQCELGAMFGNAYVELFPLEDPGRGICRRHICSSRTFGGRLFNFNQSLKQIARTVHQRPAPRAPTRGLFVFHLVPQEHDPTQLAPVHVWGRTLANSSPSRASGASRPGC